MRSKQFQTVLLASILLAAFSQRAAAETPSTSSGTRISDSPLAALHRAAAMITESKQPLVSAQEFTLFAVAANGQAGRWTLAEAALLASGVADPSDRRYYLARCREISIEAAAATAHAETQQEKAEALVHFLFKNPLHGGFVSGQVDMRKVLDDGKFNCVSAATLFDIVARPLGINAHPVTAPGHVFLRVNDRCIEPILNKTFSAADHEAIIDGLWNNANDFVADAFGDLRSYESTNLSLVGLIYFDEGERMSREEQYGEAVVYELKALCLDAKNPLFRRCLEDNLQKWFTSSIDQKRFERAQSVATIYGQLFGNRTTTAKMHREIAAAMNPRSMKS
jgi:hypothetical protein